MLPATGAEDGQRFMAFMLEDKIGVVKLPLTGNPHLAAALIVHPQGVRAVVQPASLHGRNITVSFCSESVFAFSALTLLVGRQ